MLRKVSAISCYYPKSLLRRPLVVSTAEELIHGKYQNVIAEIDAIDPQKFVVVMCSEKFIMIYWNNVENIQMDVAISY